MDEKWYYEDHGRANGPISTRDLINKIQKGELTLLDLIFKDGQPQWLPIESYAEITELLGNITHNDAADWIVLRSVNVDGRVINEQIGPFNAQQILDLIDKGRIRFDDYVWRTGYDKWVPLGRVDQFEKPLKSSIEVDLSLYATPRQEDLIMEAPLKTVKTKTPAAPIVDEPPPQEAKGKDLALPKWAIETELAQEMNIIEGRQSPDFVENRAPAEKNDIEAEETLQNKEPEPPVREQKATETLEETKTDLKLGVAAVAKITKMSDRWWNVAVAAGVMGVLVASLLLITWGKRAFQASEPTTPVQVEPAPAAIVPSATPSPVNTVSSSDSEVRGSTSATNSEKKSVLKNDRKQTANEKNNIETGKKQTSQEKSVTKKAKNSDAGEAPSSSLSKASFKAKSHFHQKERMFIFYTSSEGMKLASDLQSHSNKNSKNNKNWNSFYNKWKAKSRNYSSKIEKEAKKAKLHRSLMKELSVTASRLDEAGKDMHSQISNGRSPTKVSSLSGIRSDFKELNGKARNLDR
jgi:hypothetical protein